MKFFILQAIFDSLLWLLCEMMLIISKLKNKNKLFLEIKKLVKIKILILFVIYYLLYESKFIIFELFQAFDKAKLNTVINLYLADHLINRSLYYSIISNNYWLIKVILFEVNIIWNLINLIFFLLIIN